MSYDEPLVGALALVFAVVAAAISVGPWTAPYQLRSVSALQDRFGKPAARGLWVAVALASLAAGLAILSDLRPSYAIPAQRAEIEQ